MTRPVHELFGVGARRPVLEVRRLASRWPPFVEASPLAGATRRSTRPVAAVWTRSGKRTIAAIRPSLAIATGPLSAFTAILARPGRPVHVVARPERPVNVVARWPIGALAVRTIATGVVARKGSVWAGAVAALAWSATITRVRAAIAISGFAAGRSDPKAR